MLEQRFGPPFTQHFLAPLAQKFAPILSPKQATFVSLFFGVLFLPLLLTHHPYLAIGSLLLSGLFDALDGTLARLKKEESPMGAALDILCDRIVEIVVIIGLFLVAPKTRAIPALIMLGSILLCVTSFLVTAIFTKNESHKSFHYSPGLIERPEAFVFFILMVLQPPLFRGLAIFFSALTLYTTFVRLIEFNKMTTNTKNLPL